jgi:hypothetical protein
MQLDKMDGVGLQMTHSMDTYVLPPCAFHLEEALFCMRRI